MAAWSQLEEEHWESIYDRLDQLLDRVRFAAVCRTFRSLVVRKQPNQLIATSRTLLLLPPPITGDSPIREFYSLASRTKYQSFVPELVGKWCCGSFFGWLFTVDFATEEIKLLNPMTRSQINLPSLSQFTDPPELVTEGEPFPRNNAWFILKTAVSSSPGRGEDFIVMAMITDLRFLAYCKPGFDQWLNLPSTDQGTAKDFIFYKDKFYVLTSWGAVVTWDLSDPHQPITTTIIPYIDVVDYDQLTERNLFLAESVTGDLLKVGRYYDIGPELLGPDGDGDDITDEDLFEATTFTVLKLDEVNNRWVTRYLSGQAMFIGCNTAICKSILYNPELVQCGIYFADSEDDPNGCKVVGCYHQFGKDVMRVYENPPFWMSPCIWITPSSL